jgi:hypothetical protein
MGSFDEQYCPVQPDSRLDQIAMQMPQQLYFSVTFTAVAVEVESLESPVYFATTG